MIDLRPSSYLAFELPASDRIDAIETASRMAAVGYDALPQWAAYEVAA